MLHAVLAWLTAAVALISVSFALATAAAASISAQGLDPTTVLTDPERSPLLSQPRWIAIGTFANEVAVLAVVGLWWWLLRPNRRVVLPLRRPTLAGLAGALLAVFGFAPFAEVAGELVHRVLQHEITATRVVIAAARGSSTGEFAALLVCLAIMPAIAEEALFRGFITAAFEKRFATAVVVPSVMFGLFHLEPTQAAGTIFLGVGFALARLCTGSLLTAVVAHAVYNGAVLLAVRYADDVIDRSIEAGPLIGGGLMLVAGVALLMRERRRGRGVDVEAPVSPPATAKSRARTRV